MSDFSITDHALNLITWVCPARLMLNALLVGNDGPHPGERMSVAAEPVLREHLELRQKLLGREPALIVEFMHFCFGSLDGRQHLIS